MSHRHETFEEAKYNYSQFLFVSDLLGEIPDKIVTLIKHEMGTETTSLTERIAATIIADEFHKNFSVKEIEEISQFYKKYHHKMWALYQNGIKQLNYGIYHDNNNDNC